MKIIKKLAAEFEIKFTSELVNSFSYLLRLTADISRIVKTDFFQFQHPFVRCIFLNAQIYLHYLIYYITKPMSNQAEKEK